MSTSPGAPPVCGVPGVLALHLPAEHPPGLGAQAGVVTVVPLPGTVVIVVTFVTVIAVFTVVTSLQTL